MNARRPTLCASSTPKSTTFRTCEKAAAAADGDYAAAATVASVIADKVAEIYVAIASHRFVGMRAHPRAAMAEASLSLLQLDKRPLIQSSSLMLVPNIRHMKSRGV